MAMQKVIGGYIDPAWIDQINRFRPLETICWEWVRGNLSEIDIELTNDCNLSCIMCPRKEMTRPIGYMDFELYKKILDENYPITINLTGMGEPLLHPDFIKMLEYAKSDPNRFIWVCLYTNAVNLNEEIAKRLIELEVDEVIIGLDANTSETYKRLKDSDNFNKVCENINRLLNMKKSLLKNKSLRYNERKPVVGLQILKVKENDSEIEPFFERWDEKDKLRKQLNWKKREQDIEDLRKKMKGDGLKEEEINQKIGELYHLLNLEWWEEFYKKSSLHLEHVIIGHFSTYAGQIEDRSVVDVTPLKRTFCRQLWRGLGVLWNGDVVICRQDFDGKYIVGNVKDHNLQDLWYESLFDLRLAHFKDQFDKTPICTNCKEWFYP